MFRPYRAFVAFIPRLWSNWLTLLGTVLTSISAVTILAALAIDFFSTGLDAYAAAILFLVVPGAMLVGLLLIPLGLFFERRRVRRSAGSPPSEMDQFQSAIAGLLQSSVMRRRVAFLLGLTVANVLLFATVTHRAVTFMETPKFCGTTCHSVMQPEYDAYLDSPHSQVACVQCHIGEGTSATVKAKVNGLHQVLGVLTGNYHRPIQTPVHQLRPANETCGNCHQANRLSGSRLGFRVHFKDDEANTPQVTAMTFNVGGKDPGTGVWGGIHSHATDRTQIRYEVLDDKRELVGKIQKLEDGKVVKEWLPPKQQAAAQVGPVRETRIMDCVDCHNRATHAYDGTPERAVDKALADGRLDRKLPWLRATAIGVLRTASPPRADAERQLGDALGAAYGRDHAVAKPPAEALAASARVLAALYRKNVYPEMHLSWNHYPSQIGHGGADPGNARSECFRCHAGDRQTADGQVLSSKCELCHEVMAKDEIPADLPDEIRPLLHL